VTAQEHIAQTQEGVTELNPPFQDARDFNNLPDDELEALAEVAKGKKRRRELIAYLASGGEGTAPDIGSRPVAQVEVEAKRPRSSAWTKFQLPTPEFKGKNWMELQTYITDLEGHFQLDQERFQDEACKVQYASSCLKGEMKPRWTIYFGQECGRSFKYLTYAEYITWCENNIVEGSTRALDAMAQLDELYQKEGEGFLSFLLRFDTTLSEIPGRLPDVFKIPWVVHKCNLWTRRNLISLGIPATWQELRSAGVRAEAMSANSKRTQPTPGIRNNHGPKTEPRQNRYENNRPESTRPTFEPAASGIKDERKPQALKLVCWKCNGTHMRRDCDGADCSRCGSTGHTTERHGMHNGPATGVNDSPVTRRA
jgi:hypothetical protein